MAWGTSGGWWWMGFQAPASSRLCRLLPCGWALWFQHQSCSIGGSFCDGLMLPWGCHMLPRCSYLIRIHEDKTYKSVCSVQERVIHWLASARNIFKIDIGSSRSQQSTAYHSLWPSRSCDCRVRGSSLVQHRTSSSSHRVSPNAQHAQHQGRTRPRATPAPGFWSSRLCSESIVISERTRHPHEMRTTSGAKIGTWSALCSTVASRQRFLGTKLQLHLLGALNTRHACIVYAAHSYPCSHPFIFISRKLASTSRSYSCYSKELDGRSVSSRISGLFVVEVTCSIGFESLVGFEPILAWVGVRSDVLVTCFKWIRVADQPLDQSDFTVALSR